MPITRAYGQASQLGNTPAASNPVINGGFDIWQRGTSLSVAASTPGYTADRWYFYNRANQASTISRQATSDTTNLPNIQYCARVQRNSGQTGTQTIYFAQGFETVNSVPFAGKTVTLSFYARKGANYSGTFNSNIVYGTGTDQNPITGYTGQVDNTQANTLTTTWQRFTQTVTVATTATEIAIQFEFVNPTGTAGAADYFEVTGVQLDIGSVALPFRRTGGTLAGELAACQRYYYLHASGATKPIALASQYSNTQLQVNVKFPVTMRTDPTLSATSGTDYFAVARNVGSDNFNSFTLDIVNTNNAQIYNASEISGTAGQVGHAYTNNASASLAFSAEL